MKTIILKQNGTGRYEDGSPCIMTDGKLEIKTELPNYNGEFFFIAANNGRTYKKVIPQDYAVTLDGLTAGELTAEIKHYVKGARVKSYKVEPLILREVDGSLSAMPEFAVLKAQTAALAEELTVLKQASAEREKQLDEWKQRAERNVSALIKFAYEDYINNVYLNGGTPEQFVKEFGLELTDEESKNIFKGEQND